LDRVADVFDDALQRLAAVDDLRKFPGVAVAKTLPGPAKILRSEFALMLEQPAVHRPKALLAFKNAGCLGGASSQTGLWMSVALQSVVAIGAERIMPDGQR